MLRLSLDQIGIEVPCDANLSGLFLDSSKGVTLYYYRFAGDEEAFE